MKIKAYWSIQSKTSGEFEFTLEDLGCRGEKEWDYLSEDEKDTRIQDAIDAIPDQPVMSLLDFDKTLQ